MIHAKNRTNWRGNATKFEWNANTIRWYQEANSYTGFFKNLSNLIAPSLTGYSSLCDIACGVGLFSLEISPYIDNITSIDISAPAINALMKSAQERQTVNIEAIVMDCAKIQGSWDIIFMSFFGGQNLERFLAHCKKLIFVATKETKPGFYPGKFEKSRRVTADELEIDLLNKSIPFSRIDACFEFGQPLRSWEEARSFVRAQSVDIEENELSVFLTQCLVKTGRNDYPYYIPRQKSMGIFEIEGIPNGLLQLPPHN